MGGGHRSSLLDNRGGGWKLNSNAPNRIVATVTRGQEDSGTFQENVGLNRQETTVRIQTFVSTVEIVAEGQKAWSRSTQTGLPGVLFATEGKTLQQAAAEYERPNLDFFSSIDLPPTVPRAKFAEGLGVSKLGTQGVTQ